MIRVESIRCSLLVWISRSRIFCARTQVSRICTSISLKWSYQSHRCILYLIPRSRNSDVIDSFISEILKYELSVIVSSTKKPWVVLFKLNFSRVLCGVINQNLTILKGLFTNFELIIGDGKIEKTYEKFFQDLFF